MRLIDIINGPWAITPDMYSEVRGLYARHMRGEKIDYAILQQLAAANKGPRKADQTYEVVNGTAIIPVEGVIAKRMNIFMALCGGASTQLVERDIRAALADDSVKQIVLYVDSPGGTVDGTFELSNFIYQNRQTNGGKKKIIGYTDGMAYSGGYALMSACDEIIISSDTNGLGSIGVVVTHDDYSKQNEMRGVKTTEIYAGKYKRIASQETPLTPEGYQSIKDEVDYLYSVFVNTVARNRGVSVEDVLTKMSTDVKSGFLGKQAIEAGLADGMATLEEIINGTVSNKAKVAAGFSLRQSAAGGAAEAPAAPEVQTAEAGGAEAETEETIVDIKELKEKHADLYQAVLDEGKAAGVAEGKGQGATAERERIKAVEEQVMPGHEALIKTLMYDGKTTGPEAAMQVLAAEKTKKGQVLGNLKASAPALVPSPAAPELETSTEISEDKSLPVEERAKAVWEKDPKVRTEFTSLAAYTAFRKAEDRGQVRIFGKHAPKE